MNKESRAFLFLLITIIIIVLILLIANTGHAAESDCAADGTVYRRYICRTVAGDDCDPFIMHAWSDEQFCKMIVYLSSGGYYLRTTPGGLCYPSGTKGGLVCMALWGDYAKAETKYDAVQDIQSVYLYSRKKDNAAYLPLLVKR